MFSLLRFNFVNEIYIRSTAYNQRVICNYDVDNNSSYLEQNKIKTNELIIVFRLAKLTDNQYET